MAFSSRPFHTAVSSERHEWRILKRCDGPLSGTSVQLHGSATDKQELPSSSLEPKHLRAPKRLEVYLSVCSPSPSPMRIGKGYTSTTPSDTRNMI